MDTQILWVSTSDQQHLCVKTFGDQKNPALVLVHGYPDHQDVWKTSKLAFDLEIYAESLCTLSWCRY